jgi:hypothetical protein
MAAEKLTEHHGCSVSRETLRGWMIVDGLGQDRRHRLRSPHQPRRRRDRLGPLPPWSGWSSYPHALGHPKQHRRAGSTASSDACTEPYLLMMAQTIIARRQPSWCRRRTAKRGNRSCRLYRLHCPSGWSSCPHRLVRHRSTRPTRARCRPYFPIAQHRHSPTAAGTIERSSKSLSGN